MPKFPEPPPQAALAATRPDTHRLNPGDLLARIYFRAGPHPSSWSKFRNWGPTNARFDHHLSDEEGRPTLGERGILYASATPKPDQIHHAQARKLTSSASQNALALCVAEVFQDTRTIDRNRGAPAFAIFRVERPIDLLDLTGHWPIRAGASLAISTGPRSRARRWSQTIYGALPEIGGLRYVSSMGGGGIAVALYERSRNSLPALPLFNRQLSDPILADALAEVAVLTGFDLV